MIFKTPDFVKKYGPVLGKDDIPYESALVFNAGIEKFNDKYVMLFRNDYGFCPQDFVDFYAGISDNTVPKTNIGLAFSDDGIAWSVEQKPALDIKYNGMTRAYDPRITNFGNGEYGVCFAIDSKSGTRGGIAVTKDFKNFDIKSISVPENRNMVLFPEKINGRYCRLERPFVGNKLSSYAVWMSFSPDLIHWGGSVQILTAANVPFANSKIGPGAPPVRTEYGWLTLFHAVHEVEHELKSWHKNWHRKYYAGVMLLDLNDPSKIIAIANSPLIVAEEEYECAGFRGEAIFPGGLLKENDEVKIYYGAADTVECLASAKIEDLINFCYNKL